MRRTGRSRSGFTLVELLVVIVILALLAALAVRAVFSAGVLAQEAVIKAEMTQLIAQLELFKQKYGAYPPSDPAAAAAYIQTMSQHVSAATAGTEDDEFTTTEQALVFWLRGVSASPSNPITGGGTKSLAFEFDTDRYDGANLLYIPPLETSTQPYKYVLAGNKATIQSAGVDDDWTTTADNITIPE